MLPLDYVFFSQLWDILSCEELHHECLSFKNRLANDKYDGTKNYHCCTTYNKIQYIFTDNIILLKVNLRGILSTILLLLYIKI